jgi:transglutaminase-like putative cysteine protease
MRQLPRNKSLRAVLLASMAGLVLLWALRPRTAQADSAPDWLRAAAAETLPKYPADTLAVVLLDDEQTTVKDNGEIEVHVRRAYKLLRPEARDQFGSAVADFSNDTKLTYMKAWTITPAGQELQLKEKDAVETSLSSYELYSDDHAKIIPFPEANPGSVVGYEIVQKQRPYIFDDVWDCQRSVPVRKARYTLQLPTGWEYTTLFSNQAELKPQQTGPNQFTWEETDVPPIDDEPDMPPFSMIAREMYLKYFPRDPAMRSKTAGTWKDIGLWYNGLTTGSREPTPAIQQKVAELTAGLTDPLAKIKALAEYVQKIRYAAIEIGIGGYQPHPAGQVFQNQYGDCKDKVTLLSAMLQEIGIQSYYVLIDSDRGWTLPDFPSVRFDHAILAIRLPDKFDMAALYATVDDPTLGRLLFFDPTDTYVPLGYLPSELQETYALVAAPGGGILMRTPLLPPTTNRLLRTATLNLSDDGNLSGEVKEVRWGGPAVDSRGQYLDAPPAQRAKVLENFLGVFLARFTVTNATLQNLENFDESLVVDYRFLAEGYAKSAGDLLILRPRVLGSKDTFVESLFNEKPRKYGVEFEEASRQDDVFDIRLPAGYVVDDLPKPIQEDCEFASYQSSVEVSGGTLHYKRTYVVKDVTVPPQKLDVIRSFYRHVEEDEKSSAVLKRTSP